MAVAGVSLTREKFAGNVKREPTRETPISAGSIEKNPGKAMETTGVDSERIYRLASVFLAASDGGLSVDRAILIAERIVQLLEEIKG